MLERIRFNFLTLSAAVAVSAALLAAPTGASAADKAVLDVNECIKQAVAVNAEVRGAEFETGVYRSKQEQADSARYPQVEVVAYGSLSPRARLANNRVPVSTTNINKPSYDGVFGRAAVQVVQPIYTFGKISSYREAAEHGVKAYEAGAKLKATEVALQVKEAYYGLLLGRELKGLLDDIGEQVDTATSKVQRQIDEGSPNVDQVVLFKLQTYQCEIRKYKAMAEEGIEKATFGLRLLTNHPDGEFEIADEFLAPADIELAEFDKYVGAAMESRLEFTQLKEGLIAKKALVKAEKAEYYPQIFAAGFYSAAGATNRDHLNNPYITDEFNHNYGGAVLGLKWNYDFGIKTGKVNEARAEYMKLKAKEEYARGGVPYQVMEAYLKVKASEQEIKALSDAYRTAKQWVVASLSNFDMGVGEPRDIAESVNSYATLKADYFTAIFNQRMAVANLEHATGKDVNEVYYQETTTRLYDADGASGADGMEDGM
ncbi:MAG: TolC family protein [Nitrospirae bacterium]|nr:TolC family protein [Nitrospirota bacterium]MBI5695903.1 TolC family protein [Nitrospirota bacterium]